MQPRRDELVPNHPRPWHRDSLFGPGPRRPLDREQRARFRFLLRAHARARRLSAKAEWVGAALLKRLGEDGRCDPAHATLAVDAGCGARTVRRALVLMRMLGLLRWTTRLVRNGWRAEQTSNAYELVPEASVPCGGQNGRGTSTERFRKGQVTLVTHAIEAPPAAVVAARRALEEVAARRLGALFSMMRCDHAVITSST
jgi:hypothetical protein